MARLTDQRRLGRLERQSVECLAALHSGDIIPTIMVCGQTNYIQQLFVYFLKCNGITGTGQKRESSRFLLCQDKIGRVESRYKVSGMLQ